MSTAQFLEKVNLTLELPLIEKKNLQRAPHGNPTDDSETFARNGGDGIGAKFFNGICRWQAQRDKVNTDDKVHTAQLQKMFLGAVCLFGFVGEVVVG